MHGSRRAPIVGADAYAAAYEEFVRPFVYRRYLDFGVFESLRDMKALIVREVARRELDQHLKLGAGGIREIEFIVQSMQLVRGGSDRRLQNAVAARRSCRCWRVPNWCPSQEWRNCTEAYLVLRKAENALQMIRDEQTHSLAEGCAGSSAAGSEHGSCRTGARPSSCIESTRDKVAAPIRGAAVRCGGSAAARRGHRRGLAGFG